MGQDDRRKYLRTKKQNIISFQIIKEDGSGETQEGVVLDGSPGGVRFRSKRSIQKNERIYIRMNSDDWGDELVYFIKDDNPSLVEIIGAVMWCLESEDIAGEYEVGTRFIAAMDQ